MSLLNISVIQNSIFFLRKHPIMMDTDVALLFGVQTKRLNEQVKRNPTRFPSDFAFQISDQEFNEIKIQREGKNQKLEGTMPLRSQIATLKNVRGQHRKYLPYAFTQSGIAMVSALINTPNAIQANIAIMRSFGSLRHAQHDERLEILHKLAHLEEKLDRVLKGRPQQTHITHQKQNTEPVSQISLIDHHACSWKNSANIPSGD